MRLRTYVRRRPIVNTTITKDTMRLMRSTNACPIFRFVDPNLTVKAETPFCAETAGARSGMMMPSVRDPKNFDTTLPR